MVIRKATDTKAKLFGFERQRYFRQQLTSKIG